jgi:3-methylcrotonyl-CoA carboxylase alpha subunit
VNTTYQVRIAERTLRVALRSAPEGVFASVEGGPEQRVSLAHVRGVLRSLVVGERRVELLGQASADAAALNIDGLLYEAEVLDELRARLASLAGAGAAAHARRELRAPMPGLVVRVGCAVGDQVEPGQALVVLQAMKMENELSLARAGAVSAVNVEAGQTVEQGQVLVVVE